jgi:hypothetical protein
VAVSPATRRKHGPTAAIRHDNVNAQKTIASTNQTFLHCVVSACANGGAQNPLPRSQFARWRFAVSTRTASAKAEDAITESASKVSKFGKAMTEEGLANAEEGYRKAMALAEEGRAAAQQTAQDFQSLSVALASKMMGFAQENLSASMQASRDLMSCRSWRDVARVNASLMQDCTRRAMSQSEELFNICSGALQNSWDHVRHAQETATRRN